MSTQPFADLHIHSNHSDGVCSPRELVDKAAKHQLRAIAIVDHDDVSALDEAFAYGRERGIEVVSGVELSVRNEGREFHLLGYGFNAHDPTFSAHLRLFKEKRLERAQQIVDKLGSLGMRVPMELVLEKAGHGTVGRPHIADALVEEGHVFSFQDAFNRFLGNGRPAYVPSHRLDARTAMEMIRKAGGVSVVAHPGLDLGEALVLRLLKLGVDGIETVHPSHNAAATQYFSDLARRYGRLQTGGSDYHGGGQGAATLGHYKVPYTCVEKLIKRLQKLQE